MYTMKGAKKKNGLPLKIIYITLLDVCSVTLAILCVYQSHVTFLKNNAVWLCFFIAILGIALLILGGWSTWKEKELLYKSIITLLFGLLFCLILLFILLNTQFFTVVKDKQSLAEYLQKSGAWMPAVYIILQFLQVVILPIPSVISTAVGVVLFGPFIATVYSLIGILLGTFVAFFIGRKLGGKAVEWLVGKETLRSWQKKLKGKDNFVLTLMFILPMFPDDILCFIAGLSSISTRYFSVMVILSRILAVTTTCYSIQFIPFNTWWGLLLWGIFIGFILFAIIYIYKNMEKLQQWISNKFKNGKT